MNLIVTRLMLSALISGFFLFSNTAYTQEAMFEDYLFISKSGDSIPAELGTFQVPNNRQNPTKTLHLSFVRFKSTNPNPTVPIIYLAGGPGGSGIKTAEGDRFELFMKLREVADVIAFDQRGTGMSNQLPKCPFYAHFDQQKPIDQQEYVDKTTENINKCLEFWSEEEHDLKNYNTTENAYDIEDLRKVLDVEKISLWGISYGSHLAFEYIRHFEAHIDKVVLASLEGPNETIKLPLDTEEFIREIAQRAKTNYGVQSTYHIDLYQVMQLVHSKLEQNPQIIPFKNRKGELDTVALSNFELKTIISAFYLKNPKNSCKLPQIYCAMQKGDFSAIAPYAVGIKRYVSKVRPMSFAMDMSSGISKERKQQVDEEKNYTLLGTAPNFLLYEWMNSIEFEPLDDAFRQLSENKVEALLLSGTMDGRTFVPAAIKIAAQFTNGQHIIIDNAGHDLFMSTPLIGDLMLAFFKGIEINISEIKLNPISFK